MLTGKKVQIRWKRYFAGQRDRVFIGEMIKASEGWLLAEGRHYYLPKGATTPMHDAETLTIAVPREAVALVRVLPDNLNLDNLKYGVENDLIVIQLPEGEPGVVMSSDLV